VTQPDPEMIDIDAILTEMDDLGRALFQAALGRVRVKKLEARVAQLERDLAATR